MIYTVTAIRDSKTGFLTPAFHPTAEAAIRDFISACRDSDCQIHDFPVDFSLVRLGTYDSDTGAITPCPSEELCRAAAYVREES